jgi:hypothetical protein
MAKREIKRQITVIYVNRRAMIARLERALAKLGRELRVDRRGRVSNFILIDTAKQAIVETDVDIEALARKLGSLEPWERLARE